MNKHNAFTLAEVLITLGIIGVVAAMTLPKLIKDYEKRVIEAQLKKTYSDIENLIKRAEVDKGNFEYWDFTTNTNWYEKYFQPYLNAKECSDKDIKYCFLLAENGNARVFRYADGTLVGNSDGHWYNAKKYMLPDGRAILIQPITYEDKDNPGSNWKYVYFAVDVNGAKGPCVMGWDVFMFTLFNYGIHKGIKLGTYLDGGGEVDYKRSTEDLLSNCVKRGGYGCGLLIQRNNWKFPKNYPIKF